jgi:hypothetical protein
MLDHRPHVKPKVSRGIGKGKSDLVGIFLRDRKSDVERAIIASLKHLELFGARENAVVIGRLDSAIVEGLGSPRSTVVIDGSLGIDCRNDIRVSVVCTQIYAASDRQPGGSFPILTMQDLGIFAVR